MKPRTCLNCAAWSDNALCSDCWRALAIGFAGGLGTTLAALLVRWLA